MSCKSVCMFVSKKDLRFEISDLRVVRMKTDLGKI
jgi:hypothetical protein